MSGLREYNPRALYHPDRIYMDFTMVWAWMLRTSDALEHGFYYGLGMDAPEIACARTWMLLWFGHGCSNNRMRSKRM